MTTIKDLRDLCKDATDHAFVDAIESIIKEFEKPREPIDPFKWLNMTPQAEELWNEALKEYANEHNWKIKP